LAIATKDVNEIWTAAWLGERSRFVEHG